MHVIADDDVRRQNVAGADHEAGAERNPSRPFDARVNQGRRPQATFGQAARHGRARGGAADASDDDSLWKLRYSSVEGQDVDVVQPAADLRWIIIDEADDFVAAVLGEPRDLASEAAGTVDRKWRMCHHAMCPLNSSAVECPGCEIPRRVSSAVNVRQMIRQSNLNDR